MNTKSFYFLILVCSNLFFLSAQTTYYVDEANGSDQNNGLSANTPLRSVVKGAGKTRAGDTLKILPGEYRDLGGSNAYNELYVPNSGREGAYITISGVLDANGNRPKIYSSSLTGITLQTKKYVIVENLEVIALDIDYKGLKQEIGEWAWQSRGGIGVIGNSHNIIVRNCYVHDFPGAGIGGTEADVVLVENNIVEHNAWSSTAGSSGIGFWQMTDQNAKNFPEYPNHRIIIKNNISRYNVQLRGSSEFSYKITDGNGIIVDDFKHMQGTDPKPYSGKSLIIGNVSYGNGGAGVNVFQTENVDVIHNTLYDNGHSKRVPNQEIPLGGAHQPIQVGGSANAYIANNLLIRGDDLISTISRFSNDESTIVFENNIHWNTTGNPAGVPEKDFIMNPRFVDATPLTQDQTNLFASASWDTTQGSALVREPTKNNNFPIHELQLRSDSPAIDAGINTGFAPFNTANPDIGAFIFTGVPGPILDNKIIGELGRSTANQKWKKVYFKNTYTNPIVITGPLSFYEEDAATVRLRNITTTSFEWRVDEWEYLDQNHATEEVHYMVVEAGTYTLANGSVVEAGASNVNTTFSSINFDTEFLSKPVVFNQIVSENEAQAVSTHIKDVSSLSFRAQLLEEENGGTQDGNRNHVTEKLHWIAIEKGVSDNSGTSLFEVDRTRNTYIDKKWFAINFELNYPNTNSVFFANIQTKNGGDPMESRFKKGVSNQPSSFTPNAIKVYGQEEQSLETETYHTSEKIGYAVFGATGDLVGSLYKNNQTNARVFKSLDLDISKEEQAILAANPPKDKRVHIVFENSINTDESVTIRLYSISGRLVMQKQFDSKNDINFPVDLYGKGVYFLKIETETYTTSKRLILK